MGLLIDGTWHDKWYDTESTGGRFVRSQSRFRNWVTADGGKGPTGEDGVPAEAGRYHLYVSYACPWAHRTLIMRALKGLEGMVGLSVVGRVMGAHGWTFDKADGSTGDALYGHNYLYELYTHAEPGCNGRVTVPVLWDRARETIVSNESADILRMFGSAFDGVGAKAGDYYPLDLRQEIDAINARIYDTVNNGVYRAGFATTQDAYEEALGPLFGTLDWLDDHLGRNRYLMGDRFTEADIRLFPTLIRFDGVYATHFKCNLKRIADYDNLSAYVRELYQMPAIRGTVHMDHVMGHYFKSHESLNPSGIVPKEPMFDLDAPHGRDKIGGQP